MTSLTKIIAWAGRNERKLGATLFAFGFITDLFTYALLPVSFAVIAFAAYLILAAVSMLVAHVISEWHELEVHWKKGIAIACPLIALYALGNLFSGFVVFYTKHSVVAVSWPFIVLLILLYAGSEYLRQYKHYLEFQTTLFFFALYAFSIFALPFATGTIGPWTFAGSTALTIIIFGLFLLMLRVLNRKRFNESSKDVLVASGIVVLLMGFSYIAEFIPPIPLALTEVGIYHSLVHAPDGYHVTAEAPEPWWHFGIETVEYTPGEMLYTFSAVAAPGNLSGSVAHRWEHYNPVTHDWITESRVTFPIVGGREGGYRGYSFHQNLAEGKWRVSVETLGGQTIGRMRFDIRNTTSAPVVTERVL